MSIETQWVLEPSVLLQRFIARTSLSEIEDASHIISRHIPRNQKLHLLADFSALHHIPQDIHEIGEVLNSSLGRSYVGWFVTVGSEDTALNFAAALMPHFTRVQHRHFQNQDEAFDFLSMMDASLPIFF